MKNKLFDGVSQQLYNSISQAKQTNFFNFKQDIYRIIILITSSIGMSQQEINKIKLVNLLISILTLGGGLFFTIGSIVYLPTLSYINGNIGAIFFIVGSAFYSICDFLSALIEPQFSPLRPLTNIGSLRALLIAIGNISFIVGSVYFLPALPSIVGDDIFTIASIFIEIPQILTFVGIYWKNLRYNQIFYRKLESIKRQVIISTSMLAVACFLFFIGTVLFKNKKSETIGLYYEGVIMFIVGSLLFLGSSVIGTWVRHRSQASYLQQIFQIQSFRP